MPPLTWHFGKKYHLFSLLGAMYGQMLLQELEIDFPFCDHKGMSHMFYLGVCWAWPSFNDLMCLESGNLKKKNVGAFAIHRFPSIHSATRVNLHRP